MNKLIFSACTALLAFGVVLSAQAFTIKNTGGTTSGTVSSALVTSADLGVNEVGTLPTSYFYFFKEWNRGASRMFTWNALASAELELNITNEKAAEMIEVEKADPKDAHGIQKAIKNYTRATENLSTRLSLLKENSENPKVATLLEKVDEQTTKHLTALNQVSERQHLTATATLTDGTNENLDKTTKNKDDDCDGDCAGINAAIKEAETKINLTLIATTEKDVDMKQKAADQIAHAEVTINDVGLRMNVGLKTAAGMLEHRESVVGGLVPGGAIISTKSATLVVTGSPGGSVAKSATLIVSGAPGGAVQSKETVATEPDVDTRPQTTDYAINTDGMGAQAGNTTDILAIYLSKKGYDYYLTASQKLAGAKIAFANEKYGEAFGQARSAEVSAIQSSRISINMTIERQTPKRDFGDRALSPTTSLIQVGNKGGVPTHTQDAIKPPPHTPLPRSIPENRIDISPTPVQTSTTLPESGKNILCTDDYNPVCGVDGKTYSNACQANVSKVGISYNGVCGVGGTTAGSAAPDTSAKAMQ